MILESIDIILKRFELWRKSHGLTQREVAETLNITRTHLNKVLNKRTPPSIQLLEKMEEISK